MNSNTFFHQNHITDQDKLGNLLILTCDHTSKRADEIGHELIEYAKDRKIIFLDEGLDTSKPNECSEFYLQLDHPMIKLLGSMFSARIIFKNINLNNYLFSNIDTQKNEIKKGIIFSVSIIMASFFEMYSCLNEKSHLKDNLEQALHKEGAVKVQNILEDFKKVFDIAYKNLTKSFSTLRNTDATFENIEKLKNIIKILCNMKDSLNIIFTSFAYVLANHLGEQYPEYKDNFRIDDIPEKEYFNHFIIQIRNLFMAINIHSLSSKFPDKIIVVSVGKLHTIDNKERNLQSIQTLLKRDFNYSGNIEMKFIDDNFRIEDHLNHQVNSLKPGDK